MKNKLKQNDSASLLQIIKPDSINLINSTDDLTVEDVVVIYAYAEAIVETVREPLVILDEGLHIKTANKAFFDFFKVTKEETYNQLIFDLGNGQWNIPELKKLLEKILTKSSHFEDFEVAHEFDDIGHRTMILNARRIILEGHKTELVLLAIEDMTSKKNIDKQKDDFIGIASHELKTPLTSIKTYIQLLQKNAKTIEDKKSTFLLDKTLKQIERMEHMMGSFLNAYQLQTGKLILKKEHFDINKLIQDNIETFEYISKSHKIHFDQNIKNDIFADKETIDQVIINLITNAIKYSPNSDQINIKSSENSNSITITIQDFGMGIPKEQQDMIFDRFFRAKGKQEQNIKGLGLGLYIAYEIVKEHGGKMWVDSRENKGATFSFTLPKIKSSK